MTAYDELQLGTLGDKKTALFLIMSDTDAAFNFLISMIYTQLFDLLCEKTDDMYGSRLPVYVRYLVDEVANIGQVPNLEKLVTTIRSREASACLVLQTQSQLKVIYKDSTGTIIGNMDSRIFLGGSEPTTPKELNQALGKEAIDTCNAFGTRDNSPSYRQNSQKFDKNFVSVGELAVLGGSKCILQLRGVRPFLSDKCDLTQHPNYKYTSDFDKRSEFNIERLLSRRLRLKTGDGFVVVDAGQGDFCLEDPKTISALVKNILGYDHRTGNTDNHLYLMVLEHYSGLRDIDIRVMTIPVFLKELDRHSFPGFETIHRSRQKVQVTYPDLAPGEAVDKRRAENEIVYRGLAENEVQKMTQWVTGTSIGQRLKLVGRFRHLTQKELGFLMGYSEKTADVRIAQYEKNARIPNAETTTKFTKVLKASPAVLSPTICASREDLLQSVYQLFLMKGGGDMYNCEAKYVRSRMEQKLGVITAEEFLEKILMN